MNHFVMDVPVIFGRKRYFFTDKKWVSGNDDYYFPSELKRLMTTTKGAVFEKQYGKILRIFKPLRKISNDELFS